MALTASRDDGVIPNPSRWQLMLAEEESAELTDAEYLAVRNHALPLLRSVVGGLMEEEGLDALVFTPPPTSVLSS
ncbi:hypothetical protein [Congregibacter sp.]|jgi:amidase|uniref:hypothetical protein n=1 Tax=Congregibacter sp. TaxID=2744308 RepID=UPI0039E4BF57